MTTATTTEELSEIYSLIKDSFKIGINSIHNLLWQMIVNMVNEESQMAFYNVYEDGRHVLAKVIKNESGYYNTLVEFADGLTDDEAFLICETLNEKVLGLSEHESQEIVDSSFQASFGS